MNTYRLCFVLMAVLALSCTKTENSTPIDDEGPNVEADYSVLIAHNGALAETLLDANAEVITKNPVSSPFQSTALPEHSYRDGNNLSWYTTNPDCTGEITKVDFSSYARKQVAVFGDLLNCELVVKSIAHSDNSMYLAYAVPGAGVKDTSYFFRTVDASLEEITFTDIELELEPVQIVFALNKVFILSLDANEEDKFALIAFDTNSGTLIHELNLDYNAQRIFKTVDNDILVSYPELHLVIHSSSMAVKETVRYNEGLEPKFGYSEVSVFGPSGNLYYPMPTNSEETDYPNIPGVYDFSTNTAVLYYFENFLTVAERHLEFEIGDTSVVSYDTDNNLILIGYQKSNNSNKGGLLRIKPIPEPAFIDNIDLDGVPKQIFIN